MFRPVPMMRVQVVVLEQDERAVLEDLGRLGILQLTRAPADTGAGPSAAVDRSAELTRCDRIRSRIDELRQSLEVPIPAVQAQEGEMGLDQAEEGLRVLEQGAAGILARRRRLVERQKELAALSERMASYRGLDVPLAGPDHFSFLHFVTGTLPPQNLEALQKEVGDDVALLPLATHKGQQSIVAVASRHSVPALERALQNAGFQKETLPVVEGATVDQFSEEGERERDQLAAELEQLRGELKNIAADFAPQVANIEQFIDRERMFLDAGQKFSRTESTVLLAGWVPMRETEALRERVRNTTGGRCVIQVSVPEESEEEQIPVLLKNNRLLRPFEMLVSTYGLPTYGELEPTLFVALSYVVMFGLMFGDAGHGFVLAAFGVVALMVGRAEKIRDIGVLLLFGGTSSMIFGIVYGSYFGIEALKKYALWHDPLEGDPMQLMYGAIGIGIGLISIGLILNIINRFRRGDMIGAFLDKFGVVGLLFYWGALLLLMKGAAFQSRGLTGLALVVFVAVPIVGWSLKEPLEHLLGRAGGHGGEGGGMGAAITESCVGAFEAILSYLANTISFVRLAAYAMSHAALLFASFMLAEEVRHISFGGSVWSLVVIILGNVVAIVLEGIIASVQALRLEYYEFFGKFFSGSGRPFDPFRLAPNNKELKP